MANFVLVLCLTLCLSCLVASNRIMKKLDDIKDRVERVEERQDYASIARRKDRDELTLRMDDIETLVNNSATGLISFEPGQSAEDETQMTNEFLIVKRAFAEEKIRSRREATKMKSTIMDVKHEVKDIIEKSDIKVNNNINSLKRSMSEMMQKSMDEIKHTMNNAVNTCSQDNEVVLDKLNKMEKLMEEQITKSQQSLPIFTSCLDLYRAGVRTSGVYDIYPAPGKLAVTVYCDMDTDGGGWTVFQRRRDGSVDFFRNWEDYAKGFGRSDGEFWLGNEHVSAFTNTTCCHELRIDLEDFEGNRAYAKYSKFQVAPREDNFRLEVSGYSGNASDSLTGVHSGKEFTTKDRDKDNKKYNCAISFTGAWWFDGCYHSHLNGRYLKERGKGVIWYFWKKDKEDSLKSTEMKFRPT